MPFLRLQSNLPAAELDTLGPRLSARLSEVLGKDEAYVMVEILPGRDMWFGGSNEPCAMIEVKSIGLTEEQAKPCAAELTEAVTEATSLAADRVFVQFATVERTMWGWDGRTFG